MSDIVPFSFDGGEIRIVMDDDQPWFVGKDVATRLGYADPTNAMKQHCKGVVKHHPLQTAGGIQNIRILAEPDVLRLIIGSKLPAAERFERWVFEEVLPSIRRTGSYAVPAAAAPADALTLREKLAVLVAHKRVFGPASTRALWQKLGLPLADPLDDPRPDPSAWRDCLHHLVSAAGPLVADRAADLVKLGLRLSEAGLTIANTAPDLFAGTEWAEGKHVAALRAAPGAQPVEPVRFGPSLKVRATLVPLDVLNAVLHEVGQ